MGSHLPQRELMNGISPTSEGTDEWALIHLRGRIGSHPPQRELMNGISHTPEGTDE